MLGSILNTFRQTLSNLYSDHMLCTPSDTFRILAYSELSFCSGICRHTQLDSVLLRRIQAYSGILSALYNARIFKFLPHSEPRHIQSRRFNQNPVITQTCSEPCATLAYTDPGKLGILKYSEPFHNCISTYILNLSHFGKFTNIQDSGILKTGHIFRNLSKIKEFFAKIVKSYNCFSNELYLKSLTRF